MTCAVALKEWQIVVDALAAGEQLLLLRKGGIRDRRGTFQPEHREFLLYPTLEHQHPEMIRPEFRGRMKTPGGDSQGSPCVILKVYAGVALGLPVSDVKSLAGLEGYHVWTSEFLTQRMSYKPQLPLWAMVIRAYRLKRPVSHPAHPDYAGCKSWVPLTAPIPVEGIQPVVDNQKFRQALEKIHAQLMDARVNSR